MTELNFRDLTQAFGTQVEGLDTSGPLDDETSHLLQGAFDRRGLLRFSGLDIDRAYQTYLVELLAGPDLQPAPERVAYSAERQANFYISNTRQSSAAPFGELQFHSDAMWSYEPYVVLSLYGEQVQPPVAPTLFLSTTHAWATLPDDLRDQVEDREVTHSTDVQTPTGQSTNRFKGNHSKLLQPTREASRSTTTPLALTNPRTGQKMLYVSPMMTADIVGLPADESEALLNQLFAHLEDPAHTLSLDWDEGDLVIWDNLAVQHARPDVPADGPVRTLRKVASPATPGMVAEGEQPVYGVPTMG